MANNNISLFYNDVDGEMTIIIKGIESKTNPLYKLITGLLTSAVNELPIKKSIPEKEEQKPPIPAPETEVPLTSADNGPLGGAAPEKDVPLKEEGVFANKDNTSETKEPAKKDDDTSDNGGTETNGSATSEGSDTIYYKWPRQFNSFKELNTWITTNLPGVTAKYDAGRKAIAVTAGAEEMDKKFTRL